MPEVQIAFTDCISVAETQTDTRLITYSNENDFAGISYSVDPKPEFNIRIKSKFFKERYPEENESEELSNGQVVKLSGSVKTQKLLQVEPCPYFIHSTLKLVLQHNYILIDGEEWEKEEAYEMKELNEKYPFESAECWLTKKDGAYYTNTYGNV